MNRRAILRAVAVLTVVAGTMTANGSAASPLSPDSPGSVATTTDPTIAPTTDPLTTDPATTDPATTDPATTDPATTPPPTTAPPTTAPPTTAPPTTAPPTTAPPTTAPPTSAPAPPGGGTTVPPAQGQHSSAPVAAKPHPHKTPRTPAPQRPHPHKTLGPVLPQRDHPRRKPWPITVMLNTVPVLPGVHFAFDGHVLVTAANGRASYTAEHDFSPHTLTVTTTSLQLANRRYQFARWTGQRDPNKAFLHTVTGLPLRQSYVITAGFTVQQQVTPRFVEENGNPLDVNRISSITVKSDTGQLVNLSATSPVWLDGMRQAYHHSALTAEPATYSLQSVIVHGTNVVDAGRQSFKPASNATPTFTTQFHDLVITGHDALFKSAMGKTAIVTYPDGIKQTLSLDAHHTVSLRDLPRGTYSVVVKAGSGIVAADVFALSKDKKVNLPVISLLDIAVLLAAALAAALALVAIGRRWWRYRLVRKLRRSLRRDSSFAQEREDVLT